PCKIVAAGALPAPLRSHSVRAALTQPTRLRERKLVGNRRRRATMPKCPVRARNKSTVLGESRKPSARLERLSRDAWRVVADAPEFCGENNNVAQRYRATPGLACGFSGGNGDCARASAGHPRSGGVQELFPAGNSGDADAAAGLRRHSAVATRCGST